MRYILIIFLCMVPVIAYAADPLTESGERFLEEQRNTRQLQQLQNRQEGFQPKISFEDIPSESVCFSIHTVKVSGNSVLSYREISGVVNKYKDKCLGKEAINQLMQQLTSKYIDNGYVTSRVYIPPQDLSSGNLELIVVEGYVESVSINNNSEEDRRKLWWAMSPGWGKHLKLPEIEQALDQINSVQSANASMKLWPGQKTGSTHVQIINNHEDEFRGEISLSNDGQKDTGQYRTRLSLYGDNLIGINDGFSGSIITSENTNALSLSLGVPFRWWTFNASHSYSEYLNVLPENTDLFGQSNTTTINSDYLVFRDQSRRINAAISLTHRYSERHLLGIQLQPQRQVPVRFSVNFSQNNTWGFYSAEIGYSQGTRLLGSDEDADDMPESAPKSQFQKQDVRIVMGAPIGLFSYQMTMAGQNSDSPLYSSEQIHLGDQSSVRGTETTFASGDKGFYVQNTLSLSGSQLANSHLKNYSWLNAVGFRMFSDYGRVWSDFGASAEYGASAGIGVSSRLWRLNIDASWSELFDASGNNAGQNVFLFSLGMKAF